MNLTHSLENLSKNMDKRHEVEKNSQAWLTGCLEVTFIDPGFVGRVGVQVWIRSFQRL